MDFMIVNEHCMFNATRLMTYVEYTRVRYESR